MDIDELRRRAMDSMPHKKKQQQPPQVQPQKVSSDPQPGKSPANSWLDASVIQTPVISCAPSAPSAPSFSGSRKERDVFLSTFQELHPRSISPAAEGKDDNLVIRFSDGESDSDAEENNLKMDERHGDVSFRANILGPSANHSPAASSQLTLTPASQHAPRMWNQMAMMKQQLAAVRTSMSSAIQVRGDGPTWKSSSKQKQVIGQKGSIGQKRGVKPGASITKPSGRDLDNLKKKIAIKGGTDLENLRKQIATKGGTDLENLRKQIATKENELKLQRHIKSGKGQGMVSVPDGKLHIPGVGESTVGSTGRQLSMKPASLMLAGTSDMETGEEKHKVLQVTLQELSDAGLKVNVNGLQQQRRNPLNIDAEYTHVKDGPIDKDPIRDLHSAGSKRPHTEDVPVGRKYQKAAVDIDERKVASTQSVFDSVQKHCTRVESNIYSSNFSISMPASTPSKWVMPVDFHHTAINCFLEREGNKKCKVDGSTGSRNDVNLSRGQALAQYTPEHQKHSAVEGFQNKLNSENVQVISREGEEVQMEIEKTERLVLNESVKTADIENFSQKTNPGLTREKMSISETSGDVPQGAQKTEVPTSVTSREVVEWQCGNVSLQNLMKEEQLFEKELEEAREHRSRCEREETLAWKAYHKAQTVVQATNQRTRLEASEHPCCKLNEHPGCKLNEHGSVVDYVIISSSQPRIGNNSSSSKCGYQSVEENSNGRLSMADVVPNAAKESCVAEQKYRPGIIDTTGENDENCELMSKSSITPEILPAEKKLVLDKTGEPDFEQATTERNCLPQKRKWSNLIPASECGADGHAKFSRTSVSKLNSGDSLSLTEKTKEEGTASPHAETSSETLHGQNYDQEYNIQFPVPKHEEFSYACSESLERILEVPEEVVKTITVRHLTDNVVHGSSAGTCHSENSLASDIVSKKTINKRFATIFSNLKCEKVNFEESNEDRCLSGSSIDEGCAAEKETIVVWKNSIKEHATSGNSCGYQDCEQHKLLDLKMLADFNGRSAASDAAYMENQDPMQQIVCDYAAQKTLGENFTHRNIQAVNRKLL
ncbi:hypothetical protein KI387_014021 [Taxus chinensis]|uniref:Uncharacterized protein n=1 Tax=Taxus chinensis TaxID=29808 RepID=A0AA38FH13_TAXCH|nr:hypothetical protein KI387_014021 [Taxus chinensis]